jgi:hypothetical protein
MTESADTSVARRLLAIYLQDHYAAAGAGVRLARRLRQRSTGGEPGRELAELADQIAFDRKQLEQVLRAQGVRPSRLKGLFARVGESAFRLKPNGSLSSYSPLNRLLDLETLHVGITGKRDLWRALIPVFGSAGAPLGVDLASLETSATGQLERVERLHRAAAHAAFGAAARNAGALREALRAPYAAAGGRRGARP